MTTALLRRMWRKPEPGRFWIYVLGLVDGTVKVGQTGFPRCRQAAHRRIYRDKLAWFHLCASGERFFVLQTECDAVSKLSRIANRVGRTEMFTGISRREALAAVRSVISDAREQRRSTDRPQG